MDEWCIFPSTPKQCEQTSPRAPLSISITCDCGTYFLSSPSFSRESCISVKGFFNIATWLRLATKKYTFPVNKICLATTQCATSQSQHASMPFCSVIHQHSCPVSLMCLSCDPSSDFLPIVLILNVAQPPWDSISGRLNTVHKKFYNFLSYPQCLSGVFWYPYLSISCKWIIPG